MFSCMDEHCLIVALRDYFQQPIFCLFPVFTWLPSNNKRLMSCRYRPSFERIALHTVADTGVAAVALTQAV